MVGASPNALGASSPNRSSPFAIGFLQVRQAARPDLASSITFAMSVMFALVQREEQAYPVIQTQIDPRSPEYRANHETNTAAVAKLRAALGEATVGGGDKYVERH